MAKRFSILKQLWVSMSEAVCARYKIIQGEKNKFKKSILSRGPK